MADGSGKSTKSKASRAAADANQFLDTVLVMLHRITRGHVFNLKLAAKHLHDISRRLLPMSQATV